MAGMATFAAFLPFAGRTGKAICGRTYSHTEITTPGDSAVRHPRIFAAVGCPGPPNLSVHRPDHNILIR
jgi:hypothetical protein